jgi:hypothetical protein
MQNLACSTVGVFTTPPGPVAYQIIIFIVDALSVMESLFKILEPWRTFRRNSVDFNRIPNALTATSFSADGVLSGRSARMGRV